MSVLVDTPVWSAAFRRSTARGPVVEQLIDLIRKAQVRIIGAVRQETLSGIRSADQFTRVRTRLRNFPDLALNEVHFERAAEFFNTCRSRGVQGSNTDFLLCAVAEMEQMQIFTTDNDFRLFAPHIPIDFFK